MNRKDEICFMKARLIRLASEKLKRSIEDTVDLFEAYGVLKYIGSNYDILHIEGDSAIFDDIKEFLISKGVVLGD